MAVKLRWVWQSSSGGYNSQVQEGMIVKLMMVWVKLRMIWQSSSGRYDSENYEDVAVKLRRIWQPKLRRIWQSSLGGYDSQAQEGMTVKIMRIWQSSSGEYDSHAQEGMSVKLRRVWAVKLRRVWQSSSGGYGSQAQKGMAVKLRRNMAVKLRRVMFMNVKWNVYKTSMKCMIDIKKIGKHLVFNELNYYMLALSQSHAKSWWYLLTISAWIRPPSAGDQAKNVAGMLNISVLFCNILYLGVYDLFNWITWESGISHLIVWRDWDSRSGSRIKVLATNSVKTVIYS